MIKIYFDNILLDPDYYMGFSYSRKPFEEEFYLGSTSSIEASLVIPKDALPSSLSEVLITIDDEDYLYLIPDEISINDNEEAEIKLVDKMINLGVSYDISELVPISAKDLLEQICEDFEIQHDTFSFTNEDITINSYDSTLTARDYLSMISEIAGGYAEIDSSGKLVLKYYNNDNITNSITAEDVDSYKLRESITIERVVYEFGGLKKESDSDTSKYTIYLNSDNLFLQVITDEQFEDLCSNIIGFTFNNIEIPTVNKFFKNKDLIEFTDIEGDSYTILNQFNADFNGAFIGSYSSSIKNTKEETTKVLNNADKIKRIKIMIDQENNRISQLVTRTEQLEESIERLATSLDSNVVIVPVDSSNKPLEDANYDINYTVKFLSEPITLQPTTESSHTGITCTIDNTKIRFTVDSDTPISTLDNKYTFTWTYTQDDETYTSIKSIVVSLAPQGNAGVIQSDEEPTETNVLWYNTQTNKLYRYTTDGGWGEVNDYSNEITYLSDGITQLNNDLEDKISETNNNILQLQETMETNFTQTESTFNFQFDTLQNIVNSNKTDVDTELNRWSQYIRFEEGNIILGESGNEYTLKIENDRIAIYYNGNNISSWIQDTFNVGRINIGNFTFIPRANGSLSIRKRGDI